MSLFVILICLKQRLKEIEEFESHFPDGVYIKPGETNEPKVRFRALSKYCAEHGKNPIDLTDEEREQFIIHE
ncbi:hypothetical protein [Peribacillus sp. NPDC058075]|uniref:hypothetical protein n=1 Tax=unclassified Peribacillus TaxID=2675266 RepID=UPI0036DE2EB5